MKENNPGGTNLSSDTERFDQHTASIPDVIRSDDPPEILPPGAPAPAAAVETGWPLWDVEQISRLPFFFLAKRYGEQWEIESEETEAIARAWKPILDKLLPLEDTMWGTAALVTLAICGPRAMMTDWKKKKPGAPVPDQKNQTRPANMKTAASTGSPVSSEKESPEKPPAWEIFSDGPTG